MAREWQVNHIGGEKRGIDLVSLIDAKLGITVRTPLASNGSQSEAVIAWSAGRFSRSADSALDILEEIFLKDIDSEKKIADFANVYGHASLADMASPMVYVEEVPMYTEARHFYSTRVNAGQGRSTRYQDFSQSRLVGAWQFLPENIDHSDPQVLDLERGYQEVGDYSIKLYNKWKEVLVKPYTDFFKPDGTRNQNTALTARILDSCRGFLLAGNVTGFADRCSAREWARIIGLGKAGPTQLDKNIAAQIEELLAPSSDVEGYTPEVAKLIRHAQASETSSRNIQDVKNYLLKHVPAEILNASVSAYGSPIEQSVSFVGGSVGEKMTIQYVMTCFPNLNAQQAMKAIRMLSYTHKKELSSIMLQGHSHRDVMGNLGEVTGISNNNTLTFAEARDFLRHRGQGKWARLFEIRDGYRELMNRGFILPLYLSEIPEFGQLKEEYIKDMQSLYAKISEFGYKFDQLFAGMIPDSLFMNLFPLSGAMDLVLHGDPKQIIYFSRLRERNGGMINYRVLAHQTAELVANTDPLLSAIMLNSQPVPDPASPHQFFDRS